MILRYLCLLVVPCSSAPLPSAQTPQLSFWYVKGNGSSTNSCRLVKSDSDLEVSLKALGWKETDAGYPAIGWNDQKIAAVVTRTDAHARPTGVDLSADKSRAQVHVRQDDGEQESGILVVELGPPIAAATSCSVDDSDTKSTLGPAPNTGEPPTDSGKGSRSSSVSETAVPPRRPQNQNDVKEQSRPQGGSSTTEAEPPQ